MMNYGPSAVTVLFTGIYRSTLLIVLAFLMGCTATGTPGGGGSGDGVGDPAEEGGLDAESENVDEVTPGTDEATDAPEGPDGSDELPGETEGDDGTTDDTNGDADTPVEDEPEPELAVEIAFAPDGDDALYARAKSGEGIEFAVFVERTADGEPFALRELTIQSTDGAVVTALPDEAGRPIRFDDGSSSVTILYGASEGTVVYTDPTGTSTETQVALPGAIPSPANSAAALRAATTDLLCDELLAGYRTMVPALFDCSPGSDAPWCGGNIAEAALASLVLCSAEPIVVTEEELETEIETDPDPLPLSAVAFADTREGSGEVTVELNVVASGGVGPYSFAWQIVEGPVQPAAPPGSAPEVVLKQSGTYSFVVTATDANGESASGTIVVDVAVKTPLVVTAGPDWTFTIGDLVILEGSATGGDGDYAYEWFPTTGLSDPYAAQPTLTLDEPGTFTYTLTVTDDQGNQASDSTAVFIVEELLAAEAGPDKTVTTGQTVTLTGGANGGDGEYFYEWSPTTGLSDPNVAQPVLNSSSLGTGAFEFTLTVADGTGATASDTVTVTISSGGGGGATPAPTVINSIKRGADFAGGGYQVLVKFSQPMNQAAAETSTNYRINGTATNPASATLGGDDSTV
ncbi:MAG: hypothetical protein GY778_08590, partial [bacterium]|nr:hypothetical protein [bacterium]